MEWVFGLAILPVLLCGLMCIGGMVLAAVGLRRSNARRACGDESSATDVAENRRVTAEP